MRNAETVLAVIRDRGQRGLQIEDVYRQLFNPDLYLLAYGRISRNAGAMTRGVTAETVDGMSLAKIERIIEAVRFERYRWTPVRRVEIPKSNGKTRPLGIPTWSDKLLQEAIRLLLEAYYEPQFSEHSHGFRPDRGCHTALQTVQRNWTGTKWFIEGDIKGCFDNINHDVLLGILRERIRDNRFLRLIANLLKAGYLEEWRYTPTLSGTPQGGIVSPILSNIYLDRLDRFMEETLLPAYNRGTHRKGNREYGRLQSRRRDCTKKGNKGEARALLQTMRSLPTADPNDPDYRRLRYIRYADDFLLGFAGPKAEAEVLKAQLGKFLRDTLQLELSPEKTLITHATHKAARFLGYEVASQHSDSKHDKTGRRAINGIISLRLPAEVVEKKRRLYMVRGKPIHRKELTVQSDYTIVARYQSEYRGYVQYYALAQNVMWMDCLRWVMETSLLKTLANKHKKSVTVMAKKLADTIQTPSGPRKCLTVRVQRDGKAPLVARFGGVVLQRQAHAYLEDRPLHTFNRPRTQLETRLLARQCEVCGATDMVEVHHVRKLKDLNIKGRKEKPLWVQIMAAMRRKTLVLCVKCHHDLHAGKPLSRKAVAAPGQE